jgi:hypothetical protein
MRTIEGRRWGKRYACGCTLPDTSAACAGDTCPEHAGAIVECGYIVRDEAALQAEDRELDQLIENLVLAAYAAGLPNDPAVQNAVDALGEYVAEIRAPTPTISAEKGPGVEQPAPQPERGSTDYARLWEMVRQGQRVVCWVDYTGGLEGPPMRDIARARYWSRDDRAEVGVRGFCYITAWGADDFRDQCERSHVEFIDLARPAAVPQDGTLRERAVAIVEKLRGTFGKACQAAIEAFVDGAPPEVAREQMDRVVAADIAAVNAELALLASVPEREPDVLLVSASNLLRRWVEWAKIDSPPDRPSRLMEDSRILVRAIGAAQAAESEGP